MAARTREDMGASRTATVDVAVEEEAVVADMVEVDLIEVVVEVATEVVVEAWGRCPVVCCGRGIGFFNGIFYHILTVKANPFWEGNNV